MADEDIVMPAADMVKSDAFTIIPPPGGLAEFTSLSGSEARLAIVERIDEYQQKIAEMNKRVLELKSFYNVAITPFHKLPSEILIHIFRQIVPSSRQDIQLSHVCRLWRSAVHQAPDFWTGILKTASVIEHLHGLHFFGTFVERTAQLPFGISLSSGNLTVIQQLPNHHRLRVTFCGSPLAMIIELTFLASSTWKSQTFNT